jgi:dTMP kinase
MAYQGYGRRLGVDVVTTLDRIACRGLVPDLTFLIDIDTETSVQRALGRNATAVSNESRFERENAEFHRRVREGYLEIHRQNPERVKLIDGRRSPEQIAEEIWTLTDSFLTARRRA